MSNIHLEGQTSKKYEIPLSHLDFAYIEKCTDVKELEKIIRILRYKGVKIIFNSV